MAEKIYLLDAHARPVAPVRKESRQKAPAWKESPVSREAPDEHEEVIAPHTTRKSHAVPSAVPHLNDELVPESWIKPQTPAARRPFNPVRAMLALYGLGGIAPLALRVGPRQFAWAALSVVALTTWVTLAWFWTPVRGMMTSGRLPILPCLVGLVLVHGLGALAWSRAVTRTVRDARFQPENLPRMLRHPGLVAALGVFLPGSGLAMAGRAVQAGLALWNATMVTFAALVLSHSSLLWTWNVKSGVDQMPPEFIEAMFLACAAITALGGLLWAGTALDGGRLASLARRSGRMRPPEHFLARGDGLAVALVVALVAFAVTLRPGHLAHDLDSLASSLRWSGFRLVPLAMESGAAVLDPGLPQYAMRVAELHTEMGHPEKAQVIHDRLRERWEAYAQQLLQTATSGRTIQPATPMQPAHDLVPRAAELGPLAGDEGAAHAGQ